MNPQEEELMNTAADTGTAGNEAAAGAAAVREMAAGAADIGLADEQDMTLRELEEQLDQELAAAKTGTVPAGEEQDYQSIHRSFSQLALNYRPEEGYQYRFPDGNSVIMTVPDGARSSRPVKIDSFSDLLIIQVQKDGEELYYDPDGIYEEPGEYSVFLKSLNIDDSEKTITDYDAELSFSIGGDYRTDASGLTAPRGMVIRSILRDGIPVITEKNARQAFLTGDGAYRILYEAEADPAIQYAEEFILDTEAPVLWFSEDITAEEIYAPVRIGCEEPDVTVTLIKDGVELPLTEPGITCGGTYLVRAEDPAGNTADYTVRVRYGKKSSGIVWILLPLSLILILVLGIIYLRKHRAIR